MADDKPEVTIEGYFRTSDSDNYKNPRFLGGKSENGKEWQLASFTISVTCSTFDRKLIEQIKQLASKQQVRVTGVPEVNHKNGKRFPAIKITGIEDSGAIAAEQPSQPAPQPGTADPDDEDPFL